MASSASPGVPGGGHPIEFSVDYPDRALNRPTTAFRVIVAIPILIVLSTISGYTGEAGNAAQDQARLFVVSAGGLLFFGPLLMLAFLYLAALIVVVIAWFAILFTGRYPRGLFDFLVGVGRWHNRVLAYAFLLVTDEYPPFRLSP